MSVPGTAASPRSLSQHAAWSIAVRGLAEVLGRLVTLAWMVLAVRVLAADEFGAISYGLSVMLLVSAIPSWGLDTGLARRGSVEPGRLAELHAQVLLVKTVLGAAVFVLTALVLAGRGAGSADTDLVLLIMLVAGLPELWSHTARAASEARQSPLGMSVALVVQRVAVCVLVVAALAAGTRVLGVAVGMLVGSLLGYLAHLVALRRIGVRLRKVSWAQSWHVSVRGTFVLGLSSVLLAALFRVDAVLLGLLRGPEAVAVYAVAYRLVETVLFVSHAVKQAIFPVMSAGSPDRIRRGYGNALTAAAFVYLPFAVVCVVEGHRVLDLLFGEPYAAASRDVLSWLAPSPLLFAAAYFGSTALVARQRHLVVLLAASCALATNVVANLVLIPKLAGVGAAAANSMAYAVQLGVVYVAARRSGIGIRLARPLVEVALAAGVLAWFLVALDADLVVELVGGAVVYLAAWVLLARRLSPDHVAVAAHLVRIPSTRSGE